MSLCPCKSLSFSLSSFTAAEYGNIHFLTRHKNLDANKLSDVGKYNLLHLTAQHGHVTATCLLLQLGACVDGTSREEGGCGATPLHRAAFSGAISTMKILMDWNKKGLNSSSSKQRCNLLATDTSFGDNMTPLHKAASGGRYLAVQLLLAELSEVLPDCNNGDSSSLQLLVTALTSQDSQGRTPLAVAQEMISAEEADSPSVARWDSVAGGKADWNRCANLLLTAEVDCRLREAPNTEGYGQTDEKSIRSRKIVQASSLPTIPIHLTSAGSCLDCGSEGNSDQCRTASWERSFHLALANNLAKIEANEFVMASEEPDSVPDETSDPCDVDISGGISSSTPSFAGTQEFGASPTQSCHSSSKMERDKTSREEYGQHCHSCGRLCLALHRGRQDNNLLFCRSCLS